MFFIYCCLIYPGTFAMILLLSYYGLDSYSSLINDAVPFISASGALIMNMAI
jgi:hypothetical protein